MVQLAMLCTVWKLLMCGINKMKLLKPVNLKGGGIAEAPGSVGGGNGIASVHI